MSRVRTNILYYGKTCFWDQRAMVYVAEDGTKIPSEVIEASMATFDVGPPSKPSPRYSNCCNCGAGRTTSKCSYCLSIT